MYYILILCLSSPLAELFHLSFFTCKVPFAWKSAKVIPLHKEGDSQTGNNHRPVSIINNVVKVFENIINNQLSILLTTVKLLSQYQSEVFDNSCTGPTFLDLTKAFDFIDHSLLLDMGLSIPSIQLVLASVSAMCVI